MSFLDIFSKTRKQQSAPSEAPAHWVKCDSCHSLMYYKEVEANFNVCPKCGFHMRLAADKRIAMICDEGSFVEIQTNVAGAQVLLDACRETGVRRFHQVSTDEVYGDLPLDRPDLFFTPFNIAAFIKKAPLYLGRSEA